MQFSFISVSINSVKIINSIGYVRGLLNFCQKNSCTNGVNCTNTILDCPYFSTNFLPLNGEVEIVKTKDSFTVYMCMKGDFELNYNNISTRYKTGDTILIPAAMNEFILSGNASILEIYISDFV